MSRSRKGAVVALVGCTLWWTSSSRALPPGYEVSQVEGAPGGVAALAYAPDGTLYLAESGSSTLTVVSPDGSRRALPVAGAPLVSVGGMCVGPDGSTILLTDSKGWNDGLGNLYAVDVATGQAVTLVDGVDDVDDVAARASGEIFITDAVGAGGGAVHQVVPADTPSGWAALPVVTGLDYPAGLAFDPAGDLIYQQATESFVGQVYRLDIAEEAGGLVFGESVLLADGLSAAFDVACDTEGDVFVTGSGGLFILDRDEDGNFTGSASPFDNDGSAWQFATELAFLAGEVGFEPFAGPEGGRLTYVPEFSHPTLREIRPVPAPTALLMLTAAAGLLRRRRARRSGGAGT